MKLLPPALLQFLDALPDETCKVILNTNRKGHWEVEVFTRHSFDEASPPTPEAIGADCRKLAQHYGLLSS